MKMTPEQRKDHLVKIGWYDRNKNNRDNGNNMAPNANSKVKFGAPNTTRYIKNAAQWETTEEENDEEAQPGTITARINSIMSSARHANVVLCHKVSSGIPMALVDSSADTCLLGPEFCIESQSTT